MNKVFSKVFLYTLFFKQNHHHKHGVFLHTIKVIYQTTKHKDWKLIPAAILHDIGKPFVAYQDEKDKTRGTYSFTDHEEKSYQIIKDWKIISSYTKDMVRYHYLIRDMIKSTGERKEIKTEIWENLSEEYKEDLKRFIKYDDLGKS